MGRGCEAEYHHKNCPCPTCKSLDCEKCPSKVVLTTDHFTPRSIRKAWDVPPNGDGRSDNSNLQKLSPQCHKLKDRSTPSRFEFAREQKSGSVTSLTDYKDKVLVGDLRDAETGAIISVRSGLKILFRK